MNRADSTAREAKRCFYNGLVQDVGSMSQAAQGGQLRDGGLERGLIV